MKSQLSNHPLGRHFLSCTRCIHVNLNLSMLVLAAATLYLAVTAYTGLNPELMLYYHYEPINVMVLTGCAIALVLAALVGIFSSMALYFDGLVGNAIILLILVVGMTGYTIWQSITKDYTRTGELFTQLGDDIHTYPRFEEMIDTMQRELSCCGAEGFTDWTEALPVSCCPGEKNNCNPDTPSLNRGGCFDRLSEVLRYYNWMILIALGFLNSVQTVAVALSYTLCRAIRYKREEEPPTAPAYEPEPEPELEAEPEPEPEPAPEPVPEPAPQPETAPEPQTETVIIPIPPPMPPSKNILVVNLA